MQTAQQQQVTTAELEATGFTHLNGYDSHSLRTYKKDSRFHIFRALDNGKLEHSHTTHQDLIHVMDIQDLIDLGQLS